jgi:hypothetical protein
MADFEKSFQTLNGARYETNLIDRAGEHLARQIVPHMDLILPTKLVNIWNEQLFSGQQDRPETALNRQVFRTYLSLTGLDWNPDQTTVGSIKSDFNLRLNDAAFFCTLASLSAINQARQSQDTVMLLLTEEQTLKEDEKQRIRSIATQIKPEDQSVISDFITKAISGFVIARGVYKQEIKFEDPSLPRYINHAERAKRLIARHVSLMLNSLTDIKGLEWKISKSDRFRLSLISRLLRSTAKSVILQTYSDHPGVLTGSGGIKHIQYFVDPVILHIQEPFPPVGKKVIQDHILKQMLLLSLEGNELPAPQRGSIEDKFWQRLGEINGVNAETVRIGSTVTALEAKAKSLGISVPKLLQMRNKLIED